MMKGSYKKIIYLFSGFIFLVFSLVVYSNFILPEYGSIQQLRGALAAKKNLLSRQKIIFPKVQNLLAQFKGLSQLQETVSLALPLGEDSVSIFQQIQAIVRISGLTIEDLGINLMPLNDQKLGELQATVKLSGNYSGIKAFLKAVEENVRLMDIISFQIEQGGASKQNVYSLVVVLNGYFQK